MTNLLRKVLFLDFDGPMTNSRVHLAFDSLIEGKIMWSTADPVMIAFLNTMFKVHNFKTVVSSTWRHLGEMNPTGLEARETLRHWGFEGDFHNDWATPRISTGDRAEEIRAWLVAHKDEVDIHVSLDDEMLPKWTNNVKAHPNNGITEIKQLELFHNLMTGGGWNMDMLKEKGFV